MRVGGDRGDVNQRPGASFARGLGDVARAVDMHGIHPASEDSDEIDDCRRALDRVADAVCLGDVGLLEAELPDLRERLEEIGVAGVPARDADPHALLEQIFADVAADEAVAPENRDKLFVPLDHARGAIAPAFATLTRQAGVS